MIVLSCRTPSMASCIVLGMGVAVIVRTLTPWQSSLIRSLWRTPNRCSSSTIKRLKYLNWTARLSSLRSR